MPGSGVAHGVSDGTGRANSWRRPEDPPPMSPPIRLALCASRAAGPFECRPMIRSGGHPLDLGLDETGHVDVATGPGAHGSALVHTAIARGRERPFNRRPQVRRRRLRVHRIPQPCRERLHLVRGVEPRPVEPPVHGFLHPPQRRRSRQRCARHREGARIRRQPGGRASGR